MDKNTICQKILDTVKKEWGLIIPELTGFGFQIGRNYFKLWMMTDEVMIAGNNLSVEFRPSDVEDVTLDDNEVYGKSIVIKLTNQIIRIWL